MSDDSTDDIERSIEADREWERDNPVIPAHASALDGVLRQLEDVMDACCDQPLSCDRMTLTRSWRSILAKWLQEAP